MGSETKGESDKSKRYESRQKMIGRNQEIISLRKKGTQREREE